VGYGKSEMFTNEHATWSIFKKIINMLTKANSSVHIWKAEYRVWHIISLCREKGQQIGGSSDACSLAPQSVLFKGAQGAQAEVLTMKIVIKNSFILYLHPYSGE
jgi:hypothetical protein